MGSACHPCKKRKDGPPNRAIPSRPAGIKIRAIAIGRTRAVASRRPIYHPAIFACGDNWRWGRAGCRAHPAIQKNSTVSFLEILAQGEPESILTTRIGRRSDEGLSIEQAVAETGWRREIVLSHLTVPISNGAILRLGDLFVHSDAVQRLKTGLQNGVAEFHKQNPLVAGISKEALREKLGFAVFSAILDILVREKKLTISGDIVHLQGHGVVMKDEEAESKKIIEDAFASAGLKVPALKDVLAGLKVDKVRAQKIVTLLLREKVLVKISEDLVFHRDSLDALRRSLTAEKTKSPKIDVASIQRYDGSQPEVCDSITRVFGSRTSDEASGR